ncbi:MAG: TolB family protein [Anaerolineae bacterium]|nr:TolB family protein [Anaerolineae bacterium]
MIRWAGLVLGGLLLLTTGIVSAARGTPSTTPAFIVFVSDRDGNREIYRMWSDGSHLQRLTHQPSYDFDPTYAPDGHSVVFVSLLGGDMELYGLHPNGKRLTALTQRAGNDYAPAFNPRGGSLIYVAEDETQGHQLYEQGPGNTPRRLLALEAVGDKRSPAWSPDGGQLVFTAEAEGRYNLYLAQFGGPALQQITYEGGFSPSWSPDGRWIVFATTQGGVQSLVKLRVEAAPMRSSSLVATRNALNSPSWSPDGRWIIFETDGNLYQMRPNGHDIEPITSNPYHVANQAGPR